MQILFFIIILRDNKFILILLKFAFENIMFSGIE